MKAMRGLRIGQAASEKRRIRDKNNATPGHHSAANGTAGRDGGGAGNQKGRGGQKKASRKEK